MEIIFEVPAERVSFMLDLFQSITYVKNPRSTSLSQDKADETSEPNPYGDTTEYLLANPAHHEWLMHSRAQLRRGELVKVEVSDDFSGAE